MPFELAKMNALISLDFLLAQMAELADAPDSKSGSFGSEGSTPSLGTTQVLDEKHFKVN